MNEIKAGLINDRAGYLLPEDVSRNFNAWFLDEELCRLTILEKLHPKGPLCPKCNQALSEKYKYRFWHNERIKCHHCGKWFTALTGTMFQGIHMDFRAIILLALFLGINQPARYIADILGGNEETVRIWRNKFEKVRTLINK